MHVTAQARSLLFSLQLYYRSIVAFLLHRGRLYCHNVEFYRSCIVDTRLLYRIYIVKSSRNQEAVLHFHALQ
jgi:hypothetical protein